MLKKIIAIGLLLLTLFLIYVITTFKIFDVNLILLEEIKLIEKNYSIKVYNIPSNTVSVSYIQIRKSSGKTEKVLYNYKNFNSLKSWKLKNDTLYLILCDTNTTSHLTKKVYIILE